MCRYDQKIKNNDVRVLPFMDVIESSQAASAVPAVSPARSRGRPSNQATPVASPAKKASGAYSPPSPFPPPRFEEVSLIPCVIFTSIKSLVELLFSTTEGAGSLHATFSHHIYLANTESSQVAPGSSLTTPSLFPMCRRGVHLL